MTAAPSAPPPAGDGPVPNVSGDPWLGRVLGGRYKVLQRVGEGGMGTVYTAEHLTLHKQVALKLVHEADNADHAKRFVREAMLSSRIDHPNVISALDFGTFEGGTAYLAMQLVDGPTLSNVLSGEGCLTWVRAAEIGAQIADALVAAQSHGIVHRDLKPDNVIIQLLGDGTELVKVLDFGIAKYARDSMAPAPVRSTLAVTRIGAVVGTPGYMAPEQAVGKRADHRADLYSLGVLLWESVVGRRLWDFEDMQKLLAAQLNRVPASVRETTQDFTIPDGFDQLVSRLLAQQADDRPNSAALVRDELRDLVIAVRQGVLHSAPRSSPRPLGPPPLELPESATDRASQGSGAEADDAMRTRELGPGQANLHLENLAADPTRVLRVRGRGAQANVGSSFPAPRSRSAGGPQLSRPSAKLAWVMGAGLVVAASVWLGLRATASHAPTHAAPRATETLVATVQPPSVLADPVRDKLQSLVDGTSREERVSNAQALLRHVPIEDVPSYARAMARMQLAETCPQKKAELVLFQTLDDPRTLPTLVTLSQRKRGGCGHRGHEDCLGCLRQELGQLISRLETKQAQQKP